MDILLIILKWAFVISAVLFSSYFYQQENIKLSLIRKNIKDQNVIADLVRSAKHRMLYLFILLAVFTVWMLTYDFKVEDVTKTNLELTHQLQATTGSFENLGKNVDRLTAPSQDVAS